MIYLKMITQDIKKLYLRVQVQDMFMCLTSIKHI